MNYVIFVSLVFKVMLFHLKIKIKAIFSTRIFSIFSICLTRRHVCLVLKHSVHDRYFFKLNCFKLNGLFIYRVAQKKS
jgi:predicted transglutaminase-like protease